MSAAGRERGERSGGPARARHESYEEEHEEASDRVRAGIFAAGIAVGAMVGAGLALLFAPYSGEVTRELLAKRARRMRVDAGDVWEDLGDELRGAVRRGRRRLSRRTTRARWAAADLMDR